MKLLYLAERRALERFCTPITGSTLVSMKHGPVLSEAYDSLRHKRTDAASQAVGFEPWNEATKTGNYFWLANAVEPGKHLSRAHLSVVEGVWAEYGKVAQTKTGKWWLKRLTHMFPEWDKEMEGKPGRTDLPWVRVFEIGLNNDPDTARLRAEEIEDYLHSA
jgi:uncharacterized phage-associated protein